jgi:tungstate transport system substrate-binding protein
MVVVRGKLAAATLIGSVLFAGEPSRADEAIVLASTISVENSGLLVHILPEFTKETGIAVRVLAQGIGQALATAAHGDADLGLVHDSEAEEQSIAQGHGIDRRLIAWNDFILVGPRTDPAQVAGGNDAIAAFTAIAATAPFVSRGEKSGTDALEHRLWRAAGIDPAGGGGSWYRDIGVGMGAALNTASATGAYTYPIAAPGSASATRAGSPC